MERLVLWIWLSLAVTPGSDSFKKLLSTFGTVDRIYSSEEKEIRLAIGQRNSDASRLYKKDLTEAEQIYNFCKVKGVGILSYEDEEYPNSLREINTPPVLLYYRGILPRFNEDTFCSIVGTRKLSKYGRDNAFKIGYDIAVAGATVVSGMAIGIDGVALAGAIAANKPTVAIIGSGIDICYPKSHQRLAREIVKHGCVMTEYPPKTKPYKSNFPKRNRIIAAISSSTVVVEAWENSGAIFTARYAEEYSKEIYAFPGDVGRRSSYGCNLLIKNCAKLCTSAEDIISDYERLRLGKLNRFLLTDVLPVDMMSKLRELSVSATTQDDDLFNPPRVRKHNKTNDFEQKSEKSLNENKKTDMNGFDAKAIKLYKKINPNAPVLIESLVDEEYSLRDVMKYLLKLEIGGLVKMLPGEKVSVS